MVVGFVPGLLADSSVQHLHVDRSYSWLDFPLSSLFEEFERSDGTEDFVPDPLCFRLLAGQFSMLVRVPGTDF